MNEQERRRLTAGAKAEVDRVREALDGIADIAYRADTSNPGAMRDALLAILRRAQAVGQAPRPQPRLAHHFTADELDTLIRIAGDLGQSTYTPLALRRSEAQLTARAYELGCQS